MILWEVYKRLRSYVPALAGFHQSIVRLGRVRLLVQLRYSLYMIRNPADTCYGIRREGKSSVLSASLLYVLFFLLFALDKYGSGFLFGGADTGQYDVLLDAAIVFGSFLLVNACLYLICSITEGEAKWKNLYSGIIVSLIPWLLVKPFVIVLTHMLTYNERFIIELLNFLAVFGSVVLFVVMVREMNNYSYRETVKVLLLTAFSIAIALAALFVLYILYKQFGEFLIQLAKEVRFRVKTS